ncbi:MAG: 3'-5' exonuclease, partial [Rhodospirillaceae bacterium]
YYATARQRSACSHSRQQLTITLPKSGKLAMAALLEQARTASYRISAEGAPFEAKDKLKARRYRWNAEPEHGPRAWWIEVPADQVELELTFLEREVFHGQAHIPVQKITAFERYSARKSERDGGLS